MTRAEKIDDETSEEAKKAATETTLLKISIREMTVYIHNKPYKPLKMAAIEPEDIFKCTGCHGRFKFIGFGESRLNERFKTCIRCRGKDRTNRKPETKCPHGKQKSRCVECGGNDRAPKKKCEHGNPGICKFCDINGYLKNTLKQRAYRTLKRTPADDELFELLGCDIETYKNYIEAQFDGEMSWGTHGVSGWVICPIHYRVLYKDDKYKDDPKIVLHHTIMGPLWAE